MIALGEALTAKIGQKRCMKKSWRSLTKCPIQHQLAGGTREQVCAAQHIRNLHFQIIHHTCQLVRPCAIIAADHKVTCSDLDVFAHRAANAVGEFGLEVWNPQPQRQRAFWMDRRGAANARIAHFAFVRRRHRILDVSAAA
jgi:hypothetical protein